MFIVVLVYKSTMTLVIDSRVAIMTSCRLPLNLIIIVLLLLSFTVKMMCGQGKKIIIYNIILKYYKNILLILYY